MTILRAFLQIFPFDTIYIADLDAIAGNGNNHDVMQLLHDSFPHLGFWIDEGRKKWTPDPPVASDYITPVIGTETGITLKELCAFITAQSSCVLSLDFRHDHLLGNEEILQSADAWPERVIAMNLSAVGSNNGPDLSWLKRVVTIAGNTSVYCAGGIRHHSDLQILNDTGVAGVLLATALHTGQITSADFETLYTPPVASA